MNKTGSEEWKYKKFFEGPESGHRRATYKAMGYDDEDMKRPKIGIANSWSELCPGHFNLRNIAQAAVVGDALFGPVLDELDLTEVERARLEFLFDIYYPPPPDTDIASDSK